jgi:hypothetical protein
MPSLREAQRRLKTVFTHPRGVAAGLAAAGFTGARPVTTLVADQPPIPLPTRLAVYADAYFWRLLETLGQDFPSVKRVLGDDGFPEVIAGYLIRHPSRSPLINDAGAALPAFLKGHPASKTRPFLAELAALDWAVLRALFQDRLPPADPSAFTAMGSDARLRLDPTVVLMETAWAVDLLRNGTKKALSKPSRRFLLVHRDDQWAKVTPMDAAEFKTLKRLADGKTVGEALAPLKGADARKVREWFARWTKTGVVKGLKR